MKTEPILLWGLESDPPLSAVREQLHALDAAVVFADQRYVADTEVELAVGECVNATLTIRGEVFDLSSVAAAYLRPYNSCDLAATSADHAVAVDDILASWAEITSAFLVNPLPAMAVNHSKPYQLEQIRGQGWSVPETLITTDAAAAEAFWAEHGAVIYKSVSGVRSLVSRLGPQHVDRFSDIAACPTQFQRHIPGRDHRVHVVGDEVFACEVCCDADDYRYPGDLDVEIRACTLPREIEDRCRQTAVAAGLAFTGIDLRRTPEGEWFCFELNAAPGFTYYEFHTRQPIAHAVARLLMGGGSGASRDAKVGIHA
jgi:glutathione synthase/RimK-type ligase-like ATP-grasp enzyme